MIYNYICVYMYIRLKPYLNWSLKHGYDVWYLYVVASLIQLSWMSLNREVKPITVRLIWSCNGIWFLHDKYMICPWSYSWNVYYFIKWHSDYYYYFLSTAGWLHTLWFTSYQKRRTWKSKTDSVSVGTNQRKSIHIFPRFLILVWLCHEF